MEISELFWSSSIEDIKKGYVFNGSTEKYTCIICGKTFEKGIIYKSEESYFDAEKCTKIHIEKEHISMFEYLINMNKKYTGITDHQKQLLRYFRNKVEDKEIAEKLGGGSPTTVRNHRFKFKEKEKQSKIFLSIMGLLEENNLSNLITIHKGATMVDERYAITEDEREKVLKIYFKKDDLGKLSGFPSKEKRKIIILQHIVKNFIVDKFYSEKEVNMILERIFEDFVTIRRYLIEYGFMERQKDGSSYWIKN